MQGANVLIGQLWVSYDIEFYKPRQTYTTEVGAHFQVAGVPGTNFPAPSAGTFNGYILGGTGGNLAKKWNSIGGVAFQPTSTSNFPKLELDTGTDPVTASRQTTFLNFPSWFTGNVQVSTNMAWSQAGNGNPGSIDYTPVVWLPLASNDPNHYGSVIPLSFGIGPNPSGTNAVFDNVANFGTGFTFKQSSATPDGVDVNSTFFFQISGGGVIYVDTTNDPTTIQKCY